ncbi:hypothetical protein DM02DRAFT_213180 [Periconia macrospinosa]|uniref:Uncharacterized protein n=1 Tax=Periconia macrospinosa TaxID=97972 RepID=A0A2V1E0T8_9PLEO|nr:hypothetical protein DM02DRAFT_213180 [Periconia macrospinosa]
MADIEEPPHFGMFKNIMEWGEELENTIQWAWQSPGGWEGFAQVELHRAFNYHATREDHAYLHPPGQQGQRTDLAFNEGPFVAQDPDKPHEKILLELKCEGLNNSRNFKSGVQSDIAKIKQDIKEEWWIERGCTLYAVALSMSEQGHDEMRKLGMKKFNDYCPQHAPPFQLWWKMRHIAPDHFARQGEPGFNRERAARRAEIDRTYPGAPVSYSSDED